MKLGKNCHFSNPYKLFSFLAEHNFLKDSYTTALYLLDFIGLLPTFGLFHYANLTSYKRVRWGRLAGPFPRDSKDPRTYRCIMYHLWQNCSIKLILSGGHIRSLVRQSCITLTMFNNHDCAVFSRSQLAGLVTLAALFQENNIVSSSI